MSGRKMHIGDRPRHLLSCVVVGWVLLNWGWTCWFGFTNDDFQWLAGADLSGRDDWLRQAVAPRFWTLVFFRPLVQLSFALNYLVCGLDPFGYHLVNVVLHTANTLLVARLVLALGAPQAVALVSSVLFAVNPSMTWAVAWVSGRTELLCALFYLAAILAHLQHRVSRALAFFTLALCSKESAISLPLLVLAADWFGLADRRRLRRDAVAYLGVIGVYVLVRGAVVGEFAHDVLGLTAAAPAEGIAHLLRNKIAMLGMYLLDPFPLHGFLRSIAVLLLGPVAALLYAQRRDLQTRRIIRFAVAWIVVALLPYLPWPRLSPWYLYLATIGTSLLFATLGAAIARGIANVRLRTLFVVAGLIIWVGASVVHVQTSNEYERRAGLLSLRIVRAVVAAVPSPAPETVFVITGIDYLQYGLETDVNHLGVLTYGLPEAVSLWFHDRSLAVTFDPGTVWWVLGKRPVVYVHWDAATESARVVPATGPAG